MADVDVKTQDDDVGEKGGPPVDDKHDHTAQDGSGQRHPHVVVFETWTPTCVCRNITIIEARQLYSVCC